MRNCSIYTITNTVNGKVYVGSSVDMKARINRHFNHLRKGIHYNGKLQRAFSKHGEQAFVVGVVDECFVSERGAVESEWIERFDSARSGYNICPVGMSVLGAKQSPEHVARRMASKKGYKHSPETKAKLSASAKKRGGADHLHTPEVRAKAGLKLVGRPLSDEHKKKLSQIAKSRPTGRPLSDEHKKKLSQIAKSRPPPSEENRAKRSASMKRAWENKRKTA